MRPVCQITEICQKKKKKKNWKHTLVVTENKWTADHSADRQKQERGGVELSFFPEKSADEKQTES